MLAQTGADVLLLVLIGFFLMGLGLLLVQRRRS
nr:LPXTG cell wall anchor domain-containing protein [Corynebacterium meridianum]